MTPKMKSSTQIKVQFQFLLGCHDTFSLDLVLGFRFGGLRPQNGAPGNKDNYQVAKWQIQNAAKPIDLHVALWHMISILRN